MADLRINLAGIQSPNPFWLASAPPTNSGYQVQRAFEAGWGGAVWKTLGDPILNVSSRFAAVSFNGQRVAGFNNIELITDRPLDVNLKDSDGVTRPSIRSKYARRTAGPPFTTASRSGTNASAVSRERSSSADASGAPFSRSCFPSPGAMVTSVSTGAPASVPARRTRAAGSPKRTSRGSARVRGEKPCTPTWTASSRFVFPAPFGPTTSTSPGSSARSSAAYERKLRSVARATISRPA